MITKEDFYVDLTEKNQVLNYYNSLSLCHNKFELFHRKNQKINLKRAASICLFPLYLCPTFNEKKDIFIKKISQDKINGYAIVLKENQNFETFFKNEFSKSFRANIKRFVSRFETCFNTDYKMFYGNISRKDYKILMSDLHSMLINRFNQRNDENKILKNWDYYESSTYNLINNKKASLFVIYCNQTPVHICINHHFNNILFVSIPSYDIDYSKFALGNISIYKLLEWSLNNNYKLLDMAYGDLEYKRRWSTLIYPFEHHIIYKNNLIQKSAAIIEIQKIKLKNFLKSKNIDTLIQRIKNKSINKGKNQDEFLYKIEDGKEIDTNNFTQINEESREFNSIKKPINDFLYANKEHINDIRVFEILKEKEYLFVGKQIRKKIIKL